MPKIWSVVTAKGKSFFKLSSCADVEFINFLNAKDEPTSYSEDPSSWLSNLKQVLKVDKTVPKKGC